LASATFGSRKLFTPLQAADLIVYTGDRLLRELLGGKSGSKLGWVNSMNKKNNQYSAVWAKERLLSLKEELVAAQESGVIPYVIKKKGDAR